MEALNTYSTAALAYLGDSVLELCVRKHLVTLGFSSSASLNKHALEYVRASAQAEAMKRNTNTFISMLLSWFVAILSILPLGLYMFDCLNKTLCLTLTLAVPVVLAVAGVSIVLNKLNRRIVV